MLVQRAGDGDENAAVLLSFDATSVRYHLLLLSPPLPHFLTLSSSPVPTDYSPPIIRSFQHASFTFTTVHSHTQLLSIQMDSNGPGGAAAKRACFKLDLRHAVISGHLGHDWYEFPSSWYPSSHPKELDALLGLLFNVANAVINSNCEGYQEAMARRQEVLRQAQGALYSAQLHAKLTALRAGHPPKAAAVRELGSMSSLSSTSVMERAMEALEASRRRREG